MKDFTAFLNKSVVMIDNMIFTRFKVFITYANKYVTEISQTLIHVLKSIIKHEKFV